MPAAADLVPVERIDRYLERQGWSWRAVERGNTPLTLDQIQAAIIVGDPVLWSQLNLVERNADGFRTWEFFGYQSRSMRYLGSTIHQCGAEVGKTRRLVARHLWAFTCRRGDQLITADLDGQLDMIWDEIQFQIQSNPWLRSQIDEDACRVKPYRKLVHVEGNIMHLRPAGFDGGPLRGLHVMLASFDEATKTKNARTFEEFFARILPGGTFDLYSTPDGDRGCRFYQLCVDAADADQLIPADPSEPIAPIPNTTAVRFVWSKEQMPAPFWTPERRRKLIDQYGGVDSSGYQQLVLGRWGDPASTVFPWDQFSRCLGYVADFVEMRLTWQRGDLLAEARVLNPRYRVRTTGDLDTAAEQPTDLILDDTLDAHNVDLEALLRRALRPIAGQLIVGVDVGGSDSEPTEISIRRITGESREWIGRIQLRRAEYDQQLEVIRALDRIFTPALGWGFDAGGVGQVVTDLASADPQLSGRVSGYVFNSRMPAVNVDTGEEITDPATGRQRTVSLKELSTQLLQLSIQRQLQLIPWVQDYVRDFPSHTARRLPSGERKFSGINDHTIDSARVAELRLYELGVGMSDQPCAEAPEIDLAVPIGSVRESMELMEALS